MSLLNKTKDNTIFLDTFICLKNCVWTFHFFLKAYALQKKLDYCGRPKPQQKTKKPLLKVHWPIAAVPLASLALLQQLYCGGNKKCCYKCTI